MWRKVEVPDGVEIYQFSTDERTASLSERRTVLGADPVTGTVHLTYRFSNGSTSTITYPPAVARTIGAALIEAGLIAGSAIPR